MDGRHWPECGNETSYVLERGSGSELVPVDDAGGSGETGARASPAAQNRVSLDDQANDKDRFACPISRASDSPRLWSHLGERICPAWEFKDSIPSEGLMIPLFADAEKEIERKQNRKVTALPLPHVTTRNHVELMFQSKALVQRRSISNAAACPSKDTGSLQLALSAFESWFLSTQGRLGGTSSPDSDDIARRFLGDGPFPSPGCSNDESGGVAAGFPFAESVTGSISIEGVDFLTIILVGLPVDASMLALGFFLFRAAGGEDEEGELAE